MFKLQGKLILISLILSLAMTACTGATPAPEPTAVPSTATSEPTATAVPPTATPVPPTDTPVPTATSTSTPVPPTNTPAPTNTPRPTDTSTPAPTKVVTPKPTATKGVASSGGGVSSKPSSLAQSAQQGLDTVLNMTGILDQMLSGGSELCLSLQQKFQSIVNAPQYDVNNQPPEMQQAYGLYRQAIDVVNSQSETIADCGKGGGTIGRNNLGALHRLFAQAATLFGQALDLTKRAGGVSAGMPLVDAVSRVRAAMSYLGKVFQGGGLCQPFVAEYNILVNAPSYDVGAQPPNVQTAHSLYRRAIEIALPQIQLAVDVCNKGGGSVGKLDYGKALPVLRQAEGLLIQALSQLGQ